MSNRICVEHEEAIIAAYLGGASLKEAAAPLGYTPQTTLAVLRRYNIPTRNLTEATQKVPVEHQEAMVAAYLAGTTAKDAAAQFGYSQSACLDALRRRNISTRTRPGKAQVPVEHQEAMVAAYLAGASAKEAAARFGHVAEACRNALKRRGIKTRNISEAMQVPLEHQEAMVAAYLDGASAEEAGALFGYSKEPCVNALQRRGIPLRTISEAIRQHSVNERFFATIDTEEKAYWLGLLTADGSVRVNSVTLVLHAKDEAHLYKFKTSLQAEHPVYPIERERKGKHEKYFGIRINSQQMVQDLAAHGVVERKSLIVEPSPYVPDEFARDYWRGEIDGDGSIGYGRAAEQWSVSLCGSEAIVRGFQQFASQYINSKAQIRPNGKIFSITYTGSAQARKLLEVLYGGATVYLERKMVRAEQCVGHRLRAEPSSENGQNLN
jgi:DNA-directed RNA polymerase specialized sigma24 family protein